VPFRNHGLLYQNVIRLKRLCFFMREERAQVICHARSHSRPIRERWLALLAAKYASGASTSRSMHRLQLTREGHGYSGMGMSNCTSSAQISLIESTEKACVGRTPGSRCGGQRPSLSAAQQSSAMCLNEVAGPVLADKVITRFSRPK
jgi:hypothetical protein